MKDPEIFPKIKPDHAEAIGYVAAHWSLVEEFLGFIIYNLLNLHTIPGWAATAELSTLQRVNTISTFLNLIGNKSWIETWDDIAKTLDDLRNRRNDVIHSTWRVVGPIHWRMRVKARGRITIKQGPIYTPSLRALSDEILALEERVAEFSFTLMKGGAAKAFNVANPPGWSPPTQDQSPKSPSRSRNPKRERQQLSRAGRRREAIKKQKT